MGFFHIMNVYHYCTVTVDPLILLLDPIMLSSMLHASPMLQTLSAPFGLGCLPSISFFYGMDVLNTLLPSCHQAESSHASLLICGERMFRIPSSIVTLARSCLSGGVSHLETHSGYLLALLACCIRSAGHDVI